MKTKFDTHMENLWELAGEIGSLGEDDNRYARVYSCLANALDEAEAQGLIVIEELE